MEDFLIAMALSILFRVIKNPESVKKLRSALRKLRDQLNALDLDSSNP